MRILPHSHCMRVMLQPYLLVLLLLGSSVVAENKPNVLFISVDDLRTELGCYGASHIQSPHIDRLAAQGIQFDHAYIQQSICMASRASIMTGYRPESKMIYTGASVKNLMPNVLTLNKHFATHNYAVAAYGKVYHYKSDHTAQFGDAWSNDHYSKWTARGYATKDSIEKIALNEAINPEKYKDRGPAYEAADVEDNGYIDGYNTELAIETLKTFKSGTQPFFLAVGFHKPHLPFNVPKKYWDLYPLDTITPADIRTPPLHSNQYTLRNPGELRNYYGMPKERGSPFDLATELTLRRGYFAAVSYIDTQVGRLLETLDTLGLTENTIIVLWGDHGYKLGDYGNWCKWTNLKIDTRVPLIVSAPGMQGGKRSDALVELVDLYPTLCELSGLPVPDHLEGSSFVPLLKEPDLPWKQAVFTIWPHDRKKPEKTITGYSVKTIDYNYVEWRKVKTNQLLERELYDQKRDPHETVNEIDNPAYAAAVISMEKLLRDGWKSVLPK